MLLFQLLSVRQLTCYLFCIKSSFRSLFYTDFGNLSLISFFCCVSFSNKVVAKAPSKNNYNDQNGKWLNSFPFRALPITPKLIIKLVPLPFSCGGKSSGMYTPKTIIMAVSTSLMNPSITVCIHNSVEKINSSNNPINETISILKMSLLFIVCRIFVKSRLAKISVQPTTMVLISNETPKLSRVNCVR